jgi:hypothetical protein
VQYKIAAAGLGVLGNAARAAGRLWPLSAI